jgi:hypothetical protein
VCHGFTPCDLLRFCIVLFSPVVLDRSLMLTMDDGDEANDLLTMLHVR